MLNPKLINKNRTSSSNPLGLNVESATKSKGIISPQEEALQSLCKQLLKSRVFRGFYEERRYVEVVSGYRDIVMLQRNERELEKLLQELRQKLYMFYHQKPHFWIGVTHKMPLTNPLRPHALTTAIWTELEDIAFGQYWFLIKTIRFRDDEILLKLKMVREVETEFVQSVPRTQRFNSTSISDYTTPVKMHTTTSTESQTTKIAQQDRKESISTIKTKSELNTPTKSQSTPKTSKTNAQNVAVRRYSQQIEYTDQFGGAQISYKDFVEVLHLWGNSIKHSIYNFMANDVTKDNFKAIIRFIGLLVITLFTSAIGATRFLGVFTLRFMFEASRLTQALTPIVFKIIDVFNKLIGGFYILLTMIWKDAFVNRNQQPINPRNIKPIEYNVQKSKNTRQTPRFVEFERKFQ